jgi:DNA-binding Lrp family transcriptional regulator
MIINSKDKLILFELFQNARQPLSKIARTLKIPEKSVANRVQKMIDDKVIRKFTAIVNYQNLGMNRHSLYLDLKAEDRDKERQLVEEVLKITDVSCCYFLHEVSKWKLYISVWTSTIGEYDEIQSKIMGIFGQNVINYISFQSVRSYTYLSRILNPAKIAKCDVMEGVKYIKLTEDEKKLVRILKNNSRMPLLEIAKELNVHTDTVKRKIKKLTDQNVILRFYPLINFQKVGVREYTFISRLNPSSENAREKTEEFIKWARNNHHFVIVIKAVGWVNLYYAFQVENDEQFKEIRREIQNRIGDITLKEFRIEVEQIIN